jgi:Short C-terminal domain
MLGKPSRHHPPAAPASDCGDACMADVQAMARQWAQQDYAGEPMPPASAPNDPADKLAELTDRCDHGLITDAEFNEQKARILGEV